MTYKTITAKEAVALMAGDDSALLIDVRTRDEFDEAHIFGAINFPLYELLERVTCASVQFCQAIIIYCETGQRSRSAAMALACIGYTNVLLWQD